VTEHCDVVIIGTGAGGGTIANVLTVMANAIRVGNHLLQRMG
jgi:choline dehydrogenase-like flavoprotein